MRVKLVDLLTLEDAGTDLFRASVNDTRSPRLFGGLVAGQALVAATRTVPVDRPVHSFHSYFLRPGDTKVPVEFTVNRERDGRSFTTRHIIARQHDEAIFSMTASFQGEEEGFSHQEVVLDAPPPEESLGLDDWFEQSEFAADFADWLADYREKHPVELRFPQEPTPLSARRGPMPSRQGMWMRSRDPLPDDRLTHVCSLTYASDLYLMSTAMRPHGVGMMAGSVVGASLDHAMWFHADFRADEWLYYDQHSPWSGGSRGLNFGHIFTPDGRLVATVVQEGLMRPRTRA